MSTLNGHPPTTPDELTFQSGGVELRGWLRRAPGGADAPCVILAHGFDGVHDQGLPRYAEAFNKGGFATLVFDYRGFGASKGEPRQNVSNRAQLEDWRAAVELARREGFERIALWGTSTSGGHVVKVAASDPRIAAVVTQMPFADGLAQLFLLPPTQSLRLLFKGALDQVAAWFGKEIRVPAGGQPYALAVNTTRDALSGLYGMTPEGSTWENYVLARFALTTSFYRPGTAARRLGCPLLVCVGDADRLIARKPALKLAEAGGGELRRYRYGHFGMYGAGFSEVVADQLEFLQRTLLDGRADR
jgi:fermentation-respiration switch protein FrsA (DUF1100 family)